MRMLFLRESIRLLTSQHEIGAASPYSHLTSCPSQPFLLEQFPLQESLSPPALAEEDVLSRIARISSQLPVLSSALSEVLALLLIILLGPPPLGLAEDRPAPPQSDKLRASDRLDIDLTEDAARKSFDAFTIAWMRKLTKIDRHQEKITETASSVSVQYLKYLPTRFTVVKKTNSMETPFIGILTYFQRQFHSIGATREAALEGPFEELGTKQVSEIFRYTRGKWVY